MQKLDKSELLLLPPPLTVDARLRQPNHSQSNGLGNELTLQLPCARCVSSCGAVLASLMPPLVTVYLHNPWPWPLQTASLCGLTQVFALPLCLRQPFNITSASHHQALEHCQAPPLNTIIIQSPLNTNTLYSLWNVRHSIFQKTQGIKRQISG